MQSTKNTFIKYIIAFALVFIILQLIIYMISPEYIFEAPLIIGSFFAAYILAMVILTIGDLLLPKEEISGQVTEKRKKYFSFIGRGSAAGYIYYFTFINDSGEKIYLNGSAREYTFIPTDEKITLTIKKDRILSFEYFGLEEK